MNEINPDIWKILDDLNYDDSVKDVVRKVLGIELKYAAHSNYKADKEIVATVATEEDKIDD